MSKSISIKLLSVLIVSVLLAGSITAAYALPRDMTFDEYCDKKLGDKRFTLADFVCKFFMKIQSDLDGQDERINLLERQIMLLKGYIGELRQMHLSDVVVPIDEDKDCSATDRFGIPFYDENCEIIIHLPDCFVMDDFGNRFLDETCEIIIPVDKDCSATDQLGNAIYDVNCEIIIIDLPACIHIDPVTGNLFHEPNCEIIIIEEPLTVEELITEEERVRCYQIYDPVCGTDGKTYDNMCWLDAASVELANEGMCKAPANYNTQGN